MIISELNSSRHWLSCALVAGGLVLVWPAAAGTDATAAMPPAATTATEPAAPPQGDSAVAPAAGTAEASAARPGTARKTSQFRSEKLGEHAKQYYSAAWGIDSLKVVQTASGNLIRFSYRVADAERAKPLGEKSNTPFLVQQSSGIVLQVPVMDKVGALRQAGPPIPGKEYWMTFSNKGNYVKVGDRVNVIIGSFHADGLAVE